jgi:hypothetical protein
MADQSNGSPSTPLTGPASFEQVGTFTQLPDGTIVPELTEASKEEAR